MTRATTNVHPARSTNLRLQLEDHRVNNITGPYFALSIEDVTFFLDPEQLTQLADAVAQYRTDYTMAMESEWDYADRPLPF